MRLRYFMDFRELSHPWISNIWCESENREIVKTLLTNDELGEWRSKWSPKKSVLALLLSMKTCLPDDLKNSEEPPDEVRVQVQLYDDQWPQQDLRERHGREQRAIATIRFANDDYETISKIPEREGPGTTPPSIRTTDDEGASGLHDFCSCKPGKRAK